MTTPEGKNVAYLKGQVKALGGCVRKVEYSGHRGAPDLMVMFPDLECFFFVEMKAKGRKPTLLQLREHEIMRRSGVTVLVLDSFEAIDTALRGIKKYVQTEGLSETHY